MSLNPISAEEKDALRIQRAMNALQDSANKGGEWDSSAVLAAFADASKETLAKVAAGAKKALAGSAILRKDVACLAAVLEHSEPRWFQIAQIEKERVSWHVKNGELNPNSTLAMGLGGAAAFVNDEETLRMVAGFLNGSDAARSNFAGACLVAIHREDAARLRWAIEHWMNEPKGEGEAIELLAWLLWRCAAGESLECLRVILREDELRASLGGPREQPGQERIRQPSGHSAETPPPAATAGMLRVSREGAVAFEHAVTCRHWAAADLLAPHSPRSLVDQAFARLGREKMPVWAARIEAEAIQDNCKKSGEAATATQKAPRASARL